MKALAETDAVGATAPRPSELSWGAPRRQWTQVLAAVWREAMATYAVMAASGYRFWGGF